jgi:hypothetical protein
MACTNCKQNGKTREEIREELMKSTKVIGRIAIIISLIWMALGAYGLITLIGKFL